MILRYPEKENFVLISRNLFEIKIFLTHDSLNNFWFISPVNSNEIYWNSNHCDQQTHANDHWFNVKWQKNQKSTDTEKRNGNDDCHLKNIKNFNTVWKSKDFSVTKILREINFEKESPKVIG